MTKKHSPLLPILFNPLKHHWNYVLFFISKIKREGDLKQLVTTIKKIGNSQMDMYNGSLSIEDICQETKAILKQKGKIEFADYSEWISSQNGFAKTHLSDESTWVLRLGKPETNYIHIHPARGSQNCFRIKATHLKTFIIAKAWQKLNPSQKLTSQEINLLRKHYLNESPIKSLGNSPTLRNLICQTKKPNTEN